MTHHRENFDRVYALTEAVAPAHLLGESDETEADRFLLLKEVSFSGLARLNRTAQSYFNGVPFDRADRYALRCWPMAPDRGQGGRLETGALCPRKRRRRCWMI